ncbi:hypothetical protein FB446DRAFT_820637 [Lentinula raphanica]|nr:hypothetical protein FB446DRAFT_820637 [Lentinula raphanica]
MDQPLMSRREILLSYLKSSHRILRRVLVNTAFAILRAVVARKFVVPKIYDIMDKVSEIMVTSQQRSTSKPDDIPDQELVTGVIQEYSDLLFVALVMVLANDDSSKCQEMAAHLVKVLVGRLGERNRSEMLSHLHTWSLQRTQTPLVHVSAQVYGLMVDALEKEVGAFTSSILEDVQASLEESAKQIENIDDDSMAVDLEWQLPYHCLTTLSKVAKVCPELVPESKAIDWSLVVNRLLFPHAWVRTASSRLLGTFFSLATIHTPLADNSAHFSPLSRSGMRTDAQKLCQQSKNEHLDDNLSLQTVKNLFFIGRCYATIPLATDTDGDSIAADDWHDDERR